MPGADNVSILEVFQRLGRLYMNNLRLEEAEPYTKKAFEGLLKLLGANHTHIVHASQELGLLQNFVGSMRPLKLSIKLFVSDPEMMDPISCSPSLSKRRVCSAIRLESRALDTAKFSGPS